MAGWRLARSLTRLLAQVNAAAPRRSKARDGTIGDPAHQARGSRSDHNPTATGQVCALDLTDDPAAGFDAHALADRLLAEQDPRLKYLISNGRIGSGPGGISPGRWRPYSGPNAHTKHAHISVVAGDLGDRDTAWRGVTAPRPREADDMAQVPQQEWDDVRNWIGGLKHILDPAGGEAEGELLTRVRETHALVASLHGRDAAAIAQAIPDDLARQVADELARRLGG